MILLRCRFSVCGEHFDAENFSLAAEKNGLAGGKVRYMNNTHKLTRTSTMWAGEPLTIYRKILSGIAGTNGDGYFDWETAAERYVVDRAGFDAKRAAGGDGMTTEWAQIWLREEEALLAFLKVIKEKLPPVADFCKGEYSLLLCPIYGYDATDSPSGGQHYSEKLIKALCELGAGLSSDSQEM